MIIKNLAYSVGEKKINLKEKFGDVVIKKTGIPIAYETSLSSLDLLKKAIKKCNKNDFQNVSAIIHVTQSDTYSMPNDASFIQELCNIDNDSLCFNINQGCSGFVQALGLANSLIKTYGYEKIIITTSDTYRSFLRENDRSTNSIFSDASSVNIIENKKGYKLKKFINFTDGNGAKFLIKKNKGNDELLMNGVEIFNFAKNIVINKILKKINEDKILNSIFYIHQASNLVLKEIYKIIPMSNCRSNLIKFGNTVSTSIPLLINNYPLKDKNIFLIGFGVGLSASLIELNYE